MNSTSLRYNETADPAIEIPALPRKPVFAALAGRVKDWIARSDLRQARARQRIRHERAAQAESAQDALDSLPLGEKQRLGLYRLMD